MTGFVYLIRSNAGFYKVGYSTEPERRLAGLQTGSPYQLTMIGYVPATIDHERQMHMVLAPWRVAGEWFSDCPGIRHFASQFPAVDVAPVVQGSVVAQVIDFLGGPTSAAKAIGISNPSVVMNWRSRGQIPAERVLDIEAVTGISRHTLRPDIFGAADTVEAR